MVKGAVLHYRWAEGAPKARIQVCFFVLMWNLFLRSINPDVITSRPYVHRRQSLALMHLT